MRSKKRIKMNDIIIGFLWFFGYILYGIEEKIKTLIYEIKRPKEERKMMREYVKKIKGK